MGEGRLSPAGPGYLIALSGKALNKRSHPELHPGQQAEPPISRTHNGDHSTTLLLRARPPEGPPVRQVRPRRGWPGTSGKQVTEMQGGQGEGGSLAATFVKCLLGHREVSPG